MSIEQYMLFAAYTSIAIGISFLLMMLRRILPWLLKD